MTNQINGNPAPQAQPAPGAREISEQSKQVVKMLEELLTGARAGQIVSVAAVIVMGPGNYTSLGTLHGLLELNAGVDDLKVTVSGAIRAQASAAAQQAAAGKPNIMRAPAGFDPQHRG